jgi:hypothetical protein
MLSTVIKTLIISYIDPYDYGYIIKNTNIFRSLGSAINLIPELSFTYTNLYDEDLKQLQYFSGTLNLSFDECITDNGLKYLQNVKKLNLYNTDITNQGLKNLTQFNSNIQWLNIRRCRKLTKDCLTYFSDKIEILHDDL